MSDKKRLRAGVETWTDDGGSRHYSVPRAVLQAQRNKPIRVVVPRRK